MSRLLVCTPSDLPSVNMKKRLLEMSDWEDLGSDGENTYLAHGDDTMVTIPGEHIHAEHIDETARRFGAKVDEVVFMSRHTAASGRPTLTVHPIGNYKQAEFGGESGKLVRSAPASMTDSLRKIKALNDIPDYGVSFEVTHHGPYLETPTYYIEIGSDESRWGDMDAAKILASVLLDPGQTEGVSAIGVGGGHYAPRFTEVALKHRINIGHMVPNYQMEGMDDETIVSYFKQAAEKTQAHCAYFHRRSMKKPEAERIEGLIGSAGLEIVTSKDLDPL